MNRREFLHSLLEFPQLERVEIDGVRHYVTPAGTFKSVTTILGENMDHSWLDEWKARVGEEEVAKVSGMAARRGTAVHELCEKYLMNDTQYKRGAMPVNLETFSKIRPFLDKNVGLIYGVEARLYSGTLKAAGTTDLIASYKGKKSIVDFKTSKKVKTHHDIPGYFIQATSYAMMLEELYPDYFPRVEQAVILMSVDHSDALEFVVKTDDWRERVTDIFCC